MRCKGNQGQRGIDQPGAGCQESARTKSPNRKSSQALSWCLAAALKLLHAVGCRWDIMGHLLTLHPRLESPGSWYSPGLCHSCRRTQTMWPSPHTRLGQQHPHPQHGHFWTKSDKAQSHSWLPLESLDPPSCLDIAGGHAQDFPSMRMNYLPVVWKERQFPLERIIWPCHDMSMSELNMAGWNPRGAGRCLIQIQGAGTQRCSKNQSRPTAKRSSATIWDILKSIIITYHNLH